ncbi:MAG: hypothetical protein RI897_1980 [Verrucomicrobiota bacterium]
MEFVKRVVRPAGGEEVRGRGSGVGGRGSGGGRRFARERGSWLLSFALAFLLRSESCGGLAGFWGIRFGWGGRGTGF